METTITVIDLVDAEEYPTIQDGVYLAKLRGVSHGPTRSGDRLQIVMSFSLGEGGPSLSYFLGWPTEEDKEIRQGQRSRYGARVASIKNALDAVGYEGPSTLSIEDVAKALETGVGFDFRVSVRDGWIRSIASAL